MNEAATGVPSSRMLDARGRLLMAALGFAGGSMPSHDPALRALRAWLDSWSGVGHVAAGMHRQGYDLKGLVAKDEASLYEAGPTKRWLKVARDSVGLAHGGRGALADKRDRDRVGGARCNARHGQR